MTVGLEAFVHAARRAREEDIAAHGERDFAGAFERACELEPDRFGPQIRAAVARIEAREPPTVAGELDPAFASLVGQARGHVVAEFLRRRDPASVPAPPAKATRPRVAWIVSAVAAAAAAAVLLVAYVGSSTVAPTRTGERAFEQAEHRAQTGGVDGHAQQPPARPRTEQRAATPPPAPAVEPAAEARTAPPPDTRDAPVRKRAKTRARPAPTGGDLGAQAEAAWRAGQFDEAQRLYRTIVKRSGHGRAADLAYGDLMTLARQRKQTRALARLRREYLGRFPRGRFAEEAKAGLCRTAAAGTVVACWRAYLERWPDGAYRRQATRAVDGADG